MTTVSAGIPLQGTPELTGLTQPVTTVTIPADATAPVWQPWVNMENKVLSAFKTVIDRQIGAFNGNMQAAQRLLDQAQAAAQAQTKALETAAWASFNKYQAEAQAVYNAVMGPALEAYILATQNAHTRLWENITPAERAYAQTAADATWTEGLVNGGAKLGPEAPLPGQ